MTLADLNQYLGRECEVVTDGLVVPCTVQDVRLAYGRIDFRLTPVSGRGASWFSDGRVTFFDNERTNQ